METKASQSAKDLEKIIQELQNLRDVFLSLEEERRELEGKQREWEEEIESREREYQRKRNRLWKELEDEQEGIWREHRRKREEERVEIRNELGKINREWSEINQERKKLKNEWENIQEEKERLGYGEDKEEKVEKYGWGRIERIKNKVREDIHKVVEVSELNPESAPIEEKLERIKKEHYRDK